jgi:hypothetical protein
MVMNIENNLRLYLTFLDELNLVKIVAATDDWNQRLAIMGGVKGKDQLVDLLENASIDHFTVGGDSSATRPSLPIACEITPRKMVETLEEAIRTADETQLKILRGEKPTAEESSTRRPISLSVFSSTTTVNEGLPRVQNWFKKHAQKNQWREVKNEEAESIGDGVQAHQTVARGAPN